MGAWTVLLRDAMRSSRRWQTYAVRASFSGIMLMALMGVIWSSTRVVDLDPGTLAKAGRSIFVAFSVIQIMLTLAIASFASARAVIEERLANTGDLIVLTRLGPSALLMGNLGASLLLLVMIIVGALPILALVVTMGGVSVIEVVAVTSHALTTAIVLGCLGALFAQFTSRPVLAALAAMAYAPGSFLIMPLLYVMAAPASNALGHVSPLYGTAARDLTGLLPLLFYAPVVLLVLRITGSVHRLRMSGASFVRTLAPEVWLSSTIRRLLLVLLTCVFTVLPVFVGLSWFGMMASSNPGVVSIVLRVAGGSGAWCFFAAANVLLTWIYMRVGMDVVMAVDAYINRRRGSAPLVRRVLRRRFAMLERELAGASLRSWVPLAGLWLMIVVLFAQSALWLVPGSILLFAVATLVASACFSGWTVAANLERDRREGTMDVLLTTTVSSSRVVAARLLGPAILTAPITVLAMALMFVGGLYVSAFMIEHLLAAIGIGLGAAIWWFPVWALGSCLTWVLAIRLSRPRAAQFATAALLGLLLGVVPLLGWLGADVPGLQRICRWISPPLMLSTSPVDYVVACTWMTVLSSGLYLWSVKRLRSWWGECG